MVSLCLHNVLSIEVARNEREDSRWVDLHLKTETAEVVLTLFFRDGKLDLMERFYKAISDLESRATPKLALIEPVLYCERCDEEQGVCECDEPIFVSSRTK